MVEKRTREERAAEVKRDCKECTVRRAVKLLMARRAGGWGKGPIAMEDLRKLI